MRSMAASARAARQRGSIILPAAVAILVSLVLLASADIGYVFYLKRELQKAADLSAVAAAQRIEIGAKGVTCAAPVTEAADDVARRNLVPAGVEGERSTLRCGQWLRNGTGLIPPAEMGDPTAPAEWHFREGGSVNAVWVRLDLDAPKLMPFLPLSRGLMAHAVAVQDAPVAAFSVGAQLLRFEASSPLGVLMKQIGVNPDVLTVLDSSGLANATLTPGGLLEALGIPIAADLTLADFNGLLAVRDVSVGQVLQATAEVVGQDRFTALGLNALNAIRLRPDAGGLLLRELRLPLGSSRGGRGLFAEIIAPAGAVSGALSATLTASDLVSTLLSVAAFDERITKRPVALAADVLSLAGVRASLRVVEPPSIGIGGVGTKAYNAQIRALIDVDTNNMPLLGTVLGILGARLHLPIHLDLVGAQGELTDLSCQGSTGEADIAVTSNLLHACIAHLAPSALFSSADLCEPRLSPAQPLITLFGQPVLRDVLPATGVVTDTSTLKFSVSRPQDLPMLQTTMPSTAKIGTATENLTSLLLSAARNLFAPPTSVADNLPLDLARTYLQRSSINGEYNVAGVVALLKQGQTASDGGFNLPGLGSWEAKQGIPYRCGLLGLGLGTCWRDGDVWEGFERLVSGNHFGLVDGLLGGVLGLLSSNCRSLTTGFVKTNGCIEEALATYLKTSPTPLGSPPQPNYAGRDCGTSLLCRLVEQVVGTLVPVLDGMGATVSTILAKALGVELGRTEVRLLSLGCYNARLVY